MNAALSRRVARVMLTSVMFSLSPSEKLKLARAVDKAERFEDLDPKWQELIWRAETELKARRKGAR